MNLGWKPAILTDFRCINLPRNETADEHKRACQTSCSREAVTSLIRTTKFHTNFQIKFFQMEKESVQKKSGMSSALCLVKLVSHLLS